MATRKRPKNITFVERGSIGFPEKGTKKAIEQAMNSSHGLRKPMDSPAKEKKTGAFMGNAVTAAFEGAFNSFLKRTPFESDEIQIYRHGVVIRPKSGQHTTEVINQISELLKEIPGASAHIVEEDSTFSIRVNIGTSRKGTDFENVVNNLDEYNASLERIRRYVEDEYGDVDWFTFWDTEEAMYE